MRHYKVSLRICNEELDIDDLTKSLDIEPTKTLKVGDDGALGPAKTSVWLWQARTDSGSENWEHLEEGLQQVIHVFGTKRGFLEQLQQKCEVLLFCGYFTDDLGGPTLSPSILKSLGNFGVELFLDTYLYDQ